MGVLSWLFGSNNGGNGSSAAQAVVVGSIDEEYTWVQRNCPGFKLRMQAIEQIDGKHYDVLHIRNEQGADRTVYFDISSFYG